MKAGRIQFLDEASGAVSLEHPLTPHFRHLVDLERQVGGLRLPNSKVPTWLQNVAESCVQFCSGEGAIYFYDFATGQMADGFDQIVRRAEQSHQARSYDPCKGRAGRTRPHLSLATPP